MQIKNKKLETIVAAKQPQRLEKPVRLSEQKWPEGTKPVVSIFCITYNHEKYIQDAIEGFLMQETTFPVEIFVHDDASKDSTQAILKEYAEKYPKLFRLVLQQKNQWSKRGNRQFLSLIYRQKGEFVAFCEGDDFWNSKSKLESQVSLLRENKNLSLAGHSTTIVAENGLPTGESDIPGYSWPERISLLEYLRRGCFGLHVSSWVARSACLKNADWICGLAMGDVPLMMHLADQGEVAFIPQTMSCYRRHGTSYWSARPGAWQAKASIRVFSSATKQFQGKPRRLAKQAISKHRFVLAETLYAEGKTTQAIWALIRFCLERAFLGTCEVEVPSFETGARRLKQMLTQQKKISKGS